MNLLQKALNLLRKPSAPPQKASAEIIDLEEREGGAHSKRARIKGILRRYEQGAIDQADAVEEILKATDGSPPRPKPKRKERR